MCFCDFVNENFSLCHLSNAFTLPSSFLLFLQLMRTCVLFLTDCVRTESGPVLNSSCSLCANSSGVISLFGFCIKLLKSDNICVRTSTKIFVSCWTKHKQLLAICWGVLKINQQKTTSDQNHKTSLTYKLYID